MQLLAVGARANIVYILNEGEQDVIALRSNDKEILVTVDEIDEELEE